MDNPPYPRLFENVTSYSNTEEAPHIGDIEPTVTCNTLERCFLLFMNIVSYSVPIYILQAKQYVLLKMLALIKYKS